MDLLRALRKKRFPYLLTLILLILSINIYSQNKEFDKDIVFTEIIRPYMTISPFISKLLNLDNQDLKQEIKKLWLNAGKKNIPLIENDRS